MRAGNCFLFLKTQIQNRHMMKRMLIYQLLINIIYFEIVPNEI